MGDLGYFKEHARHVQHTWKYCMHIAHLFYVTIESNTQNVMVKQTQKAKLKQTQKAKLKQTQKVQVKVTQKQKHAFPSPAGRRWKVVPASPSPRNIPSFPKRSGRGTWSGEPRRGCWDDCSFRTCVEAVEPQGRGMGG